MRKVDGEVARTEKVENASCAEF